MKVECSNGSNAECNNGTAMAQGHRCQQLSHTANPYTAISTGQNIVITMSFTDIVKSEAGYSQPISAARCRPNSDNSVAYCWEENTNLPILKWKVKRHTRSEGIASHPANHFQALELASLSLLQRHDWSGPAKKSVGSQRDIWYYGTPHQGMFGIRSIVISLLKSVWETNWLVIRHTLEVYKWKAS